MWLSNFGSHYLIKSGLNVKPKYLYLMAENLNADEIPPKLELEESIQEIYRDKGIEELKICIDKIIREPDLLKPGH
jgi:hypothetical protein